MEKEYRRIQDGGYMHNELFCDEEIDFSAEDQINDYEDIDYDVEAPEEERHEFSQFENHEVDPSLFEGFDFGENIFQGIDEPNSDLKIVPLTIKFSLMIVSEKDSSKTVKINYQRSIGGKVMKLLYSI